MSSLRYDPFTWRLDQLHITRAHHPYATEQAAALVDECCCLLGRIWMMRSRDVELVESPGERVIAQARHVGTSRLSWCRAPRDDKQLVSSSQIGARRELVWRLGDRTVRDCGSTDRVAIGARLWSGCVEVDRHGGYIGRLGALCCAADVG